MRYEVRGITDEDSVSVSVHICDIDAYMQRQTRQGDVS